ncbi:hypothetical protein OKA06_11110 [Novosphingobium sp. MW5]|nr:hypothetical protein [Novosphingobium sp. MW5]
MQVSVVVTMRLFALYLAAKAFQCSVLLFARHVAGTSVDGDDPLAAAPVRAVAKNRGQAQPVTLVAMRGVPARMIGKCFAKAGERATRHDLAHPNALKLSGRAGVGIGRGGQCRGGSQQGEGGKTGLEHRVISIRECPEFVIRSAPRRHNPPRPQLPRKWR